MYLIHFCRRACYPKEIYYLQLSSMSKNMVAAVQDFQEHQSICIFLLTGNLFIQKQKLKKDENTGGVYLQEMPGLNVPVGH